MTNLEKIIRRTLPGPKFAKQRQEARAICAGVESMKAATEFRALILNQYTTIPPVACTAIADELERVAKDQARTEEQNAEITKAITDGCPTCGNRIRRNNSLTGWWQCGQFGAVGFRDHADKPACNWQAFYVDTGKVG